MKFRNELDTPYCHKVSIGGICYGYVHPKLSNEFASLIATSGLHKNEDFINLGVNFEIVKWPVDPVKPTPRKSSVSTVGLSLEDINVTYD